MSPKFRVCELFEIDRGSRWKACRTNSESDVVNAVRLARDEGRKITVRSGGHSWAANHLRDGCVLLDLSRLKDFSIDSDNMTAAVQPGRRGSELSGTLAERGLFFPTGHCTEVCVGGYLLQGGFGWRGRELGPACMSVIGVDVVTADVEMRYADEQRDPDLFWAALGVLNSLMETRYSSMRSARCRSQCKPSCSAYSRSRSLKASAIPVRAKLMYELSLQAIET